MVRAPHPGPLEVAGSEFESASCPPVVTRRKARRRACQQVSILLMSLWGISANQAFALGDGPHSQGLLPVGTDVFSPAYMHVNGNYTIGGSILVPGAKITGDVIAPTYIKAFDVADHYVQIYATPVYGWVDGKIDAVDLRTGKRITRHVSEHGMMDAMLIGKVGLIGMPALTPAEYAKYKQGFQLAASAALTVPVGEYDSDKALNLGANVWALRLGLPMTIPLEEYGGYSLEVYPKVTFYEDNNDPSNGNDVRKQSALYEVENHLVHNFSRTVWGSLDLNYTYGGETETDGVNDDNKTRSWGSGFSLSYAFTSAFSVQGTYGTKLNSGDSGDLDFFRVKAALAF